MCRICSPPDFIWLFSQHWDKKAVCVCMSVYFLLLFASVCAPQDSLIGLLLTNKEQEKFGSWCIWYLFMMYFTLIYDVMIKKIYKNCWAQNGHTHTHRYVFWHLNVYLLKKEKKKRESMRNQAGNYCGSLDVPLVKFTFLVFPCLYPGQVRVTAGDSGLCCCTCVMYVKY